MTCVLDAISFDVSVVVLMILISGEDGIVVVVLMTVVAAGEVEVDFGAKKDSMDACFGFLESIPVGMVESAFRLSEDMVVYFRRKRARNSLMDVLRDFVFLVMLFLEWKSSKEMNDVFGQQELIERYEWIYPDCCTMIVVVR